MPGWVTRGTPPILAQRTPEGKSPIPRAAGYPDRAGRAAAHRVRESAVARAWRAVTTETVTRSTALRLVRRGGFVALGGLVVWVVVGLPFFVFPTVDVVQKHADVVLVLGPPVQERVEVAERLLAEGRVDTALVSVPGSEYQWNVQALCARSDVICFTPDPSTTRGEARALRTYSAEHGWTSAVVTTMPAHIARARSIVARCFSGRLSMVEDAEGPFNGIAYQYAYQTAATVKSWFLPGC